MPAWKTFDAHTAAALQERIDETEVTVESFNHPLFADGDSVVIAPTLQKGAALVIIGRRKMAPVEEPAQFAPLTEEIAAPSPSAAVSVEPSEPDVKSEQPWVEPPPSSEQRESEFTFGPTTWERVDQAEAPAEFHPSERGTRDPDPEIRDVPLQAPPQPAIDELPSKQASVATNNQWEEERYVATGFLGLDDYVEDEEEAARAKRPWWKRIFSD